VILDAARLTTPTCVVRLFCLLICVCRGGTDPAAFEIVVADTLAVVEDLAAA